MVGTMNGSYGEWEVRLIGNTVTGHHIIVKRVPFGPPPALLAIRPLRIQRIAYCNQTAVFLPKLVTTKRCSDQRLANYMCIRKDATR